MNPRLIVTVAFGVVALATAASGAEPNVAPPVAPPSVLPDAPMRAAPPYLALGDSIAFGDDGYVPLNDPSRADASNFVGYPSVVAEALFWDASDVYNLACPGETTASFLSATALDNGCRQYKALNPLHAPYAGTQMDAALAYLTTHPRTRLVTLNLGGNDLLLTEYACESAPDFEACVAAALPGVVADGAANVGAILTALRAAGYHGDVVFLTQYATSYSDATQLTAIPLFNGAVAVEVAARAGRVASGFDAFGLASLPFAADPCEAGLLIRNPNGTATCDVHPSVAGRDLLAAVVELTR